MATYTHPPRIYLNDVEIYELLSPKNIALRDLLKIARKRGYFFSDKNSSEDVRDFLADLPSDWALVHDVLQAMTRPDPEEKRCSTHINNCSDDTSISKVIGVVKKARQLPRGEVYQVNKISENTTRIEIGYTEVDLSRSTVYQHRARNTFIEVTHKDNKISFLHSDNDRARSIVDEIKSQIQPQAETHLTEQKVSLRGITDPAIRTQFFLNLIKSFDGYKYISATNLSVDRRLPSENGDGLTDSENSEEDTESKEAGDQMKGLVNRLAMTGKQLLASDLYQMANDNKYYIFQIKWTCQNIKDARFHLDCQAGFNDPVNGEEFTFDITKKWRFNPDSPKSQDNEPMTSSDKRSLLWTLESGAFKAFESLDTKKSKKKQK